MSEKKQGFWGRISNFISKLTKLVRTLFSVVFLIFFIIIISGMFADDLQPMPDQGALYLAPSGILVDQRSYIAPLDRFLSADNPINSETVVRDIIEALDSAGSDDRISHLILDTSYLEGAGIAKLEEISTALLNFKQSNKICIDISFYNY